MSFHPSDNTPHKHDFRGDPEQLVQNCLNLDGSDPLAGAHKGCLFVSDIHQSLESENPLKSAISKFLLYFDYPLYLLDFLVSGHGPLYIALLPEPGADGLQGTISTAPAVVIHVVLHVVVVAVDPLNQIHLENNTNTHFKKHNSTHISGSFQLGVTIGQTLLWQLAVPFHRPGRDVWGPCGGFESNHLCRAHWESGKHWLF